MLARLLSLILLVASAHAEAATARSALDGGPAAMAGAMTEADHSLRAALPLWDRRGRAPATVTVPAQDLQHALRRLARHPALARAVAPRLDGRLARTTDTVVAALRGLWRLSAGWPPHRVRVGPAEPLTALTGYYRAAERRFGVGWHVLAAVNFVESAFGRLRNASVAGAQGPMQFMPATWRAYGMGGDVRRPRDAILGAANLLRHAGASGSYARALYAYNPSPLYVAAVRRYADLIARDPAALPFFYAWRVPRGG